MRDTDFDLAGGNMGKKETRAEQFDCDRTSSFNENPFSVGVGDWAQIGC